MDPRVGAAEVVNIWSAVQDLAVGAYKVRGYDLSGFTLPRTVLTQDYSADSSVWFILRNSLNSILAAVSNST